MSTDERDDVLDLMPRRKLREEDVGALDQLVEDLAASRIAEVDPRCGSPVTGCSIVMTRWSRCRAADELGWLTKAHTVPRLGFTLDLPDDFDEIDDIAEPTDPNDLGRVLERPQSALSEVPTTRRLVAPAPRCVRHRARAAGLP